MVKKTERHGWVFRHKLEAKWPVLGDGCSLGKMVPFAEMGR